jgi:GPI-anchor transamidase subunit S
VPHPLEVNMIEHEIKEQIGVDCKQELEDGFEAKLVNEETATSFSLAGNLRRLIVRFIEENGCIPITARSSSSGSSNSENGDSGVLNDSMIGSGIPRNPEAINVMTSSVYQRGWALLASSMWPVTSRRSYDVFHRVQAVLQQYMCNGAALLLDDLVLPLRMLQRDHAEICAHLDECHVDKVDLSSVVIQWCVSVFAAALPSDSVAFAIDLLLLEGPAVLPCIAYGILVQLGPIFQKECSSVGDVLTLLRSPPAAQLDWLVVSQHAFDCFQQCFGPNRKLSDEDLEAQDDTEMCMWQRYIREAGRIPSFSPRDAASPRTVLTRLIGRRQSRGHISLSDMGDASSGEFSSPLARAIRSHSRSTSRNSAFDSVDESDAKHSRYNSDSKFSQRTDYRSDDSDDGNSKYSGQDDVSHNSDISGFDTSFGDLRASPKSVSTPTGSPLSKPSSPSSESAADDTHSAASSDTPVPPPRTTLRSTILLNFLLFLLACVPVWWYTSRVSRVPLPDILQGIQNAQTTACAQSQFCNSASYNTLVPYTVSIVLFAAPDTDLGQVAQLHNRIISQARHAIDAEQYDTSAFDIKWTVRLGGSLYSDEVYSDISNLVLSHDGTLTDSELEHLEHIDDALQQESTHNSATPTMQFFVFIDSSGNVQQSGTWVIGRRNYAWATYHAASSVLNSAESCKSWLHSVGNDIGGVLGSRVFAGSASREALSSSLRSKYKLSFTLLTADPDDAGMSWDFNSMASKYVNPMLNQLAVHGVECETVSQVKRFEDLSASLETERAGDGTYVIRANALQKFVGSTKWNVVSPLSIAPTFEFLLYVPPSEQRPLLVQPKSSASANVMPSFIVPRWGGVHIANSVRSGAKHLTSDDELEAANVFVAQLRTLLGLPNPTGDTLQCGVDNSVHCISLPNRHTALTRWEAEVWQSRRIISYLAHVESTLRSLHELLMSAPHMPVNDHIRTSVVNALGELKTTLTELHRGNVQRACKRISEANAHALDAFFHPTMMPLLYIPDEHLYAVFVPFFAPIILHIIGAIFSYLRLKKGPGDEKMKHD